MHEPCDGDETAFQRSHRAMTERMHAALKAEGERPLDGAAVGRVLGAMLGLTGGERE